MTPRLLSLAAAAIVILLHLPTPALAAHLLPVWALLDGDTPVEGGTVTVIADDVPVAQLNGTTLDRTNENGVTGLELESLPESSACSACPTPSRTTS